MSPTSGYSSIGDVLMSLFISIVISCSRGFKFVYKKILNALPSFGDDDEDPNSEANEVRIKWMDGGIERV
jgi:hypothetical protein